MPGRALVRRARVETGEIGRLTGKQKIAEWAENADIIDMLRGLGVEYAQGYGVSRPQNVQRPAVA